MRALLLALTLLLPLAASGQIPPIRVSPRVISLPAEVLRPAPLNGLQGASYSVYVYEDDDVERDYFSGSIPMFDPSASGEGQFSYVSSVDWDTSGRLEIQQSGRTRAVDAGYIHGDGASFSKFIVGSGGRTIGLMTLTEGRSFVFRLDMDQDGVVEILGVHDALNGRISHVVLNDEDTMREYGELLAGRDTFCSQPSRSTPPTGTGASFGISAQPASQIDACGEQGPKTPNIRTGSSLRRGSQASGMDAFCEGVLASSTSSPGGRSLAAQPPASTPGIPPSNTGQNVGEAIAKVGADLMDAGRAASASGPQGAIVGVPMSLLGATLRLVGGAISWGSSEPLHGEETPYDWAGYCAGRAEEDASRDLDSINDRIGEKECGDPREASGPNQPRAPRPLANRNCREVETFHDFEGLLNRMRGGCGPDPGLGAQGECSNAGVPNSGVRLDIRYADIAPPNAVKEFEDLMIPRVVNPPPQAGQRLQRKD